MKDQARRALHLWLNLWLEIPFRRPRSRIGRIRRAIARDQVEAWLQTIHLA